MKAGLQQLVDSGLQLLGAMEDAHGFTNGAVLLLNGHVVSTPCNALAAVREGRIGGPMQYRRLTMRAPFLPTLRRSKASSLDMTSTDRSRTKVILG